MKYGDKIYTVCLQGAHIRDREDDRKAVGTSEWNVWKGLGAKKPDFRNGRNEWQVGNGEGKRLKEKIREKDLGPTLFGPPRVFCLFLSPAYKTWEIHLSNLNSVNFNFNSSKMRLIIPTLQGYLENWIRCESRMPPTVPGG